jgi:hypothetical protein
MLISPMFYTARSPNIRDIAARHHVDVAVRAATRTDAELLLSSDDADGISRAAMASVVQLRQRPSSSALRSSPADIVHAQLRDAIWINAQRRKAIQRLRRQQTHLEMIPKPMLKKKKKKKKTIFSVRQDDIDGFFFFSDASCTIHHAASAATNL